MRRRPVALLAVIAMASVLAVGLHAAGIRANRQTSAVAVPGPAATPAAVAEAYVAAYNARDFSTLHQLSPTTVTGLSRFTRLGRFTDLISQPARFDDGRSLGALAGDQPAAGRVYLPVTMTAREMSAADLGFRDGPMRWGFFLERDSADEPWVIVDQGMG